MFCYFDARIYRSNKLETIVFDGTKVALIVRGKIGVDHEPDLLAQHADVILADGSPVGFFGEGQGTSGSGGSSGFGMDGIVYDHRLFQVHRPYYVDLDYAKKYKTKSTLLIITVTEKEASLFKKFWVRLKINPGGFRLVGDNCSTHASEAFTNAGIAGRSIPGLDTPNRLYKQLNDRHKTARSYSGHIGFIKKATEGGFDLVIDQ